MKREFFNRHRPLHSLRIPLATTRLFLNDCGVKVISLKKYPWNMRALANAYSPVLRFAKGVLGLRAEGSQTRALTVTVPNILCAPIRVRALPRTPKTTARCSARRETKVQSMLLEASLENGPTLVLSTVPRIVPTTKPYRV